MNTFSKLLPVVVGALALAAQPASAQECGEVTTTREMLSCLQGALSEAEKRLSDINARVESVLEAEQRLLYQQAQLAWASFRLATCNSARSLFAGGTMSPVVFVQCQLETTEERVREVQRMYETQLAESAKEE